MPVTTSRRSVKDKYVQSYPDDLSVLDEALNKGLSGSSSAVANYEDALGEWFGLSHAVAVSSGTAALTVSLAAAGVSPGDEVVMTPTAPLCTVYPIMAAGATPVFADVRSDGFGVDLGSLDKACTARTRAVIDIPMWGYPTEVDQLQAFCDDRRLPLVLDLAHSPGTTLHGESLAHYGSMSCFSTHERKPLATGEGGFILTDDSNLATVCKSYRKFGNLSGTSLGMNYKLAALPAALGLSRIRYLAEQIDQRRANARFVLERVTNPHVAELKVIDGGEPNYYSLLLRLNFSDNDAFIDYLDERGIPSDIKRYGCRCLYEFPAVSSYRSDCSRSAELLASITTLPVHGGVTQADLEYLVEVVNSYEGG